MARTCSHCLKKGHYTSSCPSLAAALLKRLQSGTKLDELSQAVKDNRPLRVEGLTRSRGRGQKRRRASSSIRRVFKRPAGLKRKLAPARRSKKTQQSKKAAQL